MERKSTGMKKQIVSQKRQLAVVQTFMRLHKPILKTKELVWDDYQPLTQFMFHSAKSSLDKIGKIHAIERTLYSEYLGLAGRVDCIAEYEGELAVIDFKTSKKLTRKWIEHILFKRLHMPVCIMN